MTGTLLLMWGGYGSDFPGVGNIKEVSDLDIEPPSPYLQKRNTKN